MIDCTNCKHTEKHFNEYPCKTCGVLEDCGNWEAKDNDNLLEACFNDDEKSRMATVTLPIKDWIYVQSCMSGIRAEFTTPKTDGTWNNHEEIFDEIEEQVVKQ